MGHITNFDQKYLLEETFKLRFFLIVGYLFDQLLTTGVRIFMNNQFVSISTHFLSRLEEFRIYMITKNFVINFKVTFCLSIECNFERSYYWAVTNAS